MKAKDFTNLLISNGFTFITGVPDSLFKDVIIDINARSEFQSIISNNEGEACAVAAGYYLSTNNIPVVYLQNSGLGNCFNPLTSLIDKYIYSIPILLLITWRAYPGEKDEPQHQRMGKILPGLLDLLEIPYQIATSDPFSMADILKQAQQHLQTKKYPYAILFPKNVIENEPENSNHHEPSDSLTRENVLRFIAEHCDEQTAIVTTTGKTSRELFEIRKMQGKPHHQDFLTVGSMGCASAIGFGISLGQPKRRVVIIDGDGACLMRLETLSLIGHYRPNHLLHIIIDNNAYESTGSQKTLSGTTDFIEIARACQYKETVSVTSLNDLEREISNFTGKGPKLIRIKVNCYSRNNLGRPTASPLENKKMFMEFLEKVEETIQWTPSF